MADVLARAVVEVGGQIDPNIGKEVAKSFDRVDDAMDDAVAALARVQSAVDDARATTSRAFGELNESSQLTKDGFGDLSSASSALGAGLAATGFISEDMEGQFTAVADTLGGLEGAFTAVQGVSQLAGGAFTALTGTLTKMPPVQKAVTIAQRAMNAVLRANPIGLVITALVLLGAGLVLAYKKSETFRKIVNGAFAAVKAVAIPVFNAVRTAVVAAFDGILAAGGKVKSFLGSLWDGISDAASAAFNGVKATIGSVIDVVNKLIRGFNRLPGPDFPEIPGFASGVRNFRGGLALVGEQGPELVNLPRGSDVYSNRDSRAMVGSSSVVVNQNYYGPQTGAEKLRDLQWTLKYATRNGTSRVAV